MESECGVAHFIEHMLFKGTKHRSAYQLSMEQNLLGGQVNAYTSQEHVVLSARVVDESLYRALKLLVEMLTESVYNSTEFERERGVILEEYKMYEDAPDELVMDMFMSALFADHALGRPILGTPEQLRHYAPDHLRAYLQRMFRPDRVVVAGCGALEGIEFLDQVEALLGGMRPGSAANSPIICKVQPTYHQKIVERDLEQTHFVLGTVGPSRLDDSRFAYAVLSTILGAGPGSRIFQEVREKRGLAYSVGTLEWYFQDTGCFAISGGTSPDTYPEVQDLCLKEVSKICEAEPTVEEVACSKAQIRTGIVLGVESTGSRMARLAEQELWYGRLIPIEESLEKLEAVSPESVLRAAQRWLYGQPLAAAILGEGATGPVQSRF
jgi:predicted Zn-dependent peptidase